MIKNYLKLAWRNLIKRKLFSFINIVGLSIGIAACMTIFLYVKHESSYDEYNAKALRIARVVALMEAPESDINLAMTPPALASSLRKDYPEVESAFRIDEAPRAIKLDTDNIREANFYQTEQSIFDVFDFDFLEGSPKNALTNPHSIVISKSTATKYFGDNKALGKTMISNGDPLMVTGVFRDRQANSDLNIQGLLPYSTKQKLSWGDISTFTFVLFKTGIDTANFHPKLAGLSKKLIQPELDQMDAKEYHLHLTLEPLHEVHFSKDKLGDTVKGNRESIYIFSLLAIFILVIALLNFINLSTARSAERSREVGIRKVVGGRPWQLLRQFIFESFLLILIAWTIGIGLVLAGLSYFSGLLETKLEVDIASSILFTLLIFVITVVLAAVYPAFILSSLKPVSVLKGSWKASPGGVLLRKGMSISQFAIAASLILATTVVYTQMKFIESKDLGFDKEQLLNVFLPTDSALIGAVDAFRDAVKQRPEIRGVTIGSGMSPAGMSIGTLIVEQVPGKKRELMCNYFAIDPQFLGVFNIKLKEGRNFSDAFGTDKQAAVIVNEAFVKAMGWQSALGRSVVGWNTNGKIVGVVKDFYYRSLHKSVEPLVLVHNTDHRIAMSLKIKPSDLTIITGLYKQYFPSTAIDYSFFDETVQKQYKRDRITATLFNSFTVLAIFISCLGLYGLVSLIAVQRTKEIGIRKVLGATIAQLLQLMTKDFLKVVLWALVIALPAAGFLMNKWLSGYAYHTKLAWWMFLLPVVILMFVSLLVIGRELLLTANKNPVKSLKTQ